MGGLQVQAPLGALNYLRRPYVKIKNTKSVDIVHCEGYSSSWVLSSVTPIKGMCVCVCGGFTCHVVKINFKGLFNYQSHKIHMACIRLCCCYYKKQTGLFWFMVLEVQA